MTLLPRPLHNRTLLATVVFALAAVAACGDDTSSESGQTLLPIEPCPVDSDAGFSDDAVDAGADVAFEDRDVSDDVLPPDSGVAVDVSADTLGDDSAGPAEDTGESEDVADQPDIPRPDDEVCLSPADFPGVARPTTINVLDWSEEQLQDDWTYSAVEHMWPRLGGDTFSHAAPVENLNDLIAWQSEGLDVFWRTLRLDLAEWTDVPPLVRVLDTESFDGYERRKIDYVVQPGLRIPAWLFVPENAENAPAIVFWHGHGNGGKDEAAAANGYTASNYHRAAAIDLVEAGYVVLVPDVRTFGETGSWSDHTHFTRALVAHGMVAMGFFVADAMVAVDVIASLDEVDPDRIGTGGISLGGQLATYLSVFDHRIKAAVIGGFFGSSRNTLLRLENDDCQYIQSLAHTMDMADVALLAAPTPLLFTIGTSDAFFPPGPAQDAFALVETGYQTLGHDDGRVELDIKVAGHEWFVEESRTFFDSHL
jgi:cephalosporin-C deacetylase-like acetyl esterase